MKSLEEMREYLKSEREFWSTIENEQGRTNVPIIDAILAALSERTMEKCEICGNVVLPKIVRVTVLEPKVNAESVKEWFEKNAPPCSCDEAYTIRGLTAPDCLRHQGLDADDLIRMVKELSLTALEPVTEEERKKMLKYLEELYTEDHPPQEHYDAPYKFILGNQGGAATEEKDICWHCGKPFSDSKHIKYGNDVENQTKHWFEPKREAGVAGKEK
jgi:hypothetical protein